VADPCIASQQQPVRATRNDIDTIVDATTFEDAQESSNRWPSSSRDDTSSGSAAAGQRKIRHPEQPGSATRLDVLEDAPDRPLPAAAAVERQLQELPTAAVRTAFCSQRIRSSRGTARRRLEASTAAPGTAFPATLLRRRLAAFPVVLPDDGAIDPGDAETANQLADRL
uniref:Rad21_Rec8 domain-containing protein n=1 Tax=Macrostomum lignano TaxID=282301 RepID=A0A1I8F2L8_9PLAT